MNVENVSKPLRFIRRGRAVSVANVSPSRTLLELLREDLDLPGTKEGCNEGDCGACAVALGESVGGKLECRVVNSCIRLAGSIDGLALWTVEDLMADDGALHPAQQALVDCHGSQCGFCTPGFAMSLFGLYQNHVRLGRPVTRELAQQALSGNLCRCTGYRPILDAARSMAHYPQTALDEPALLALLGGLAIVDRLESVRTGPVEGSAQSAYLLPRTLNELLQARAAHPDAQLVAGCTDVGLWVNKSHLRFDKVLDLTRTAELRRVERYPHHIAIGAAVTLADGYAALAQERAQLQAFANRFASLPVRNSGTLAGNVANGSPIGDSMPLLIALGASVVLMAWRDGAVVHRELALEHLYTGYRKNLMASDEVLAWVKVPRPGNPHPCPPPQAGEGARGMAPPHPSPDEATGIAPAHPSPDEATGIAPSPLRGEGWGEGCELLRAYKVSKRFDDDISAVCLVLNLRIEGGLVAKVRIGAGGVAATPARAVQTEAALLDQPWTQPTVMRAMAVLRAEFKPISDMRASSGYRSVLLGNLLQRFWLESQGMDRINLEDCANADFDANEALA